MPSLRQFAVSIVAIGALALPATASAITFGADLANLPANETPAANCAEPVTGYPLSGGAPSCMWTYFEAGKSSLFAPATGTVGRIAVKVGGTTGPMRVNVVRFLFRQTGDPARPTSAGPFLEAYGPRFTPGTSAITGIDVNMPMRADPTPAPNDTTTIQVLDALALEVENSTTPVPLYAASAASLAYGSYPGPTGAGTAAPSANALPTMVAAGVGVLLAADLTPTAAPAPPPVVTPVTGNGTPAPAPAPALIPTIKLGKPSVSVKGGAATLPLLCQVADCSGVVTLLKAGAAAKGARAAAAPKAKKAVTYGSAKFSGKAGRTLQVKVKLNTAGRALVKKRAKTKLTARVVFSAGGGATTSLPVTLRR